MQVYKHTSMQTCNYARKLLLSILVCLYANMQVFKYKVRMYANESP